MCLCVCLKTVWRNLLSLRAAVQVVLDLWEHLEICREGQMSWLSRQLDEADFIITVCSRGLR